MNTLQRGWAVALVVGLLVVSVQAAVLYPIEAYRCVGLEANGLCWLDDARLNAYVTWTFRGVPRAQRLVLEITALGRELCTYEVGRDVAISVYLGEPGLPGWRRLDATLRNVDPGASPAAYELTAEIPFSWYARGTQGLLTVRIQRAMICEPHIALGPTDVRLRLPSPGLPPDTAIEPIDVPIELPGLFPPPPDPAPLPDPQPVSPLPPGELCEIPPGGGCWIDTPVDWPEPGLIPPEQLPRSPLPESRGPLSAPRLEPGHYEGVLGVVIEGRTNRFDWLRVEAPVGQGVVLRFESTPGLVYDVHLNDVCGRRFCSFEVQQSAVVCLMPCTRDVAEHYRDPDGNTCAWLINVVRREGTGSYHMSLFEAAVE